MDSGGRARGKAPHVVALSAAELLQVVVYIYGHQLSFVLHDEARMRQRCYRLEPALLVVQLLQERDVLAFADTETCCTIHTHADDGVYGVYHEGDNRFLQIFVVVIIYVLAVFGKA